MPDRLDPKDEELSRLQKREDAAMEYHITAEMADDAVYAKPEPTLTEVMAKKWATICRAYGWNADSTTAETVIARFDRLGEAQERKEAARREKER